MLWANPTARRDFRRRLTRRGRPRSEFDRRSSSRRAGYPPGRHAAARRRAAARTAARLRRQCRRHADLPVLAPRACRQQPAAVLVVATERAGRDIALPDRARRLLADFGRRRGDLFRRRRIDRGQRRRRASASARARDLTALGAEKLAREASLNGAAEGDIAGGTRRAAPPRRRRHRGAAADVHRQPAAIPPLSAVGDLRPTNAAPRLFRRSQAPAPRRDIRPGLPSFAPLDAAFRLADGCCHPLHLETDSSPS